MWPRSAIKLAYSCWLISQPMAQQLRLWQMKILRYLTQEPVVHFSLAVADPGADAGPGPTDGEVEHRVVFTFDPLEAFPHERVAEFVGVDFSHSADSTASTRPCSFRLSSRAS